MICDTIQNAALYQGLHPNLDTALDFILTHDLQALPLGRTEIDGDRVFLNKMEAATQPGEQKLFEVHHRYMDIQIDLRGSERIDTGDVRSFRCADFSEPKDIGFGDAPTVASCVLSPGTFTVCMVGEPHKPGITVGPDTALVKCVLKVQI